MNTPITATLLGILTLLFPLSQSTSAQEVKKISIAIQPYTGFNAALTKLVSRNLAEEFDAKVTILPALALPKTAFYKPRSRYRAGKLLDHLAKKADGKFGGFQVLSNKVLA